MIPKSLLQLERCVMTNLQIATRDCPTPEPGTVVSETLDIQFRVHPHKSEPKFLIPLTLTVSWPSGAPSCYERIALTLESVFAFPPGTTEEEMRPYVPVLCLSNLLGVARGLLAQSTSLCPGGAYLLPLVNMQELLKEHTEREQGRVETAPQAIEEASPVRRPRRKKVPMKTDNSEEV